MGYSRAVRVNDRVYVAGTAAKWDDGQVDPDVRVQLRRCLEIVGEALTKAGCTFEDVVRTRLYLVDRADFDAVSQVHGEVFGSIRPANTTVIAAGLLDERWKVEIEVEAVIVPAGDRAAT